MFLIITFVFCYRFLWSIAREKLTFEEGLVENSRWQFVKTIQNICLFDRIIKNILFVYVTKRK